MFTLDFVVVAKFLGIIEIAVGYLVVVSSRRLEREQEGEGERPVERKIRYCEID